MENIEDIKSDFLAELKSLEEKFSKRIDMALENKKAPKFELGKWYKCDGYKDFMVFAKSDLDVERERVRGYGFTVSGMWDESSSHWGLADCRPATKEEIESALIKEAERRGFKEGAVIKRSEDFYKACGVGWRCDPDEVMSSPGSYYAEDDLLCMGNRYVYCKGFWAEIIKDEGIKVGGHTVEFRTDGSIQVGCTNVRNEVLEKIYKKAFGL